jgi:hypothetical protein
MILQVEWHKSQLCSFAQINLKRALRRKKNFASGIIDKMWNFRSFESSCLNYGRLVALFHLSPLAVERKGLRQASRQTDSMEPISSVACMGWVAA